jgi:hypothetical protein
MGLGIFKRGEKSRLNRFARKLCSLNISLISNLSWHYFQMTKLVERCGKFVTQKFKNVNKKLGAGDCSRQMSKRPFCGSRSSQIHNFLGQFGSGFGMIVSDLE